MKKVSVFLVFAFVGYTATAQTILKQGTTGDCSWTLTSDSVLTISGKGAMPDFESAKDAPWYDYRAEIKAVVVENGVTSIGKNAFNHFTQMKSLNIGKSVEKIGEGAFYHCRSLKSVDIPKSVLSIERIAFSGCILLEEARFPKDCTVGEAAFAGCKNLPLQEVR